MAPVSGNINVYYLITHFKNEMPEYFYENKVDKKWRVLWVVILVCIVVVSAVLLSVYYCLEIYPVVEDSPCLTEDCLKAASEFMSSLDFAQNPCEDFYQFTCGQFIESAYENNNPSYYYLQEVQNTNKINALIATEITGKEWPPALQQKRFYQSCMDTDSIDQEDNDIFKEYLKGLGGWPLLEGQKWTPDYFDLGSMIVKCQHLGFPFQWFFKVAYNGELNELHILAPEVTYQFNDPFKEAIFANLMVETASNLGTSRILAENAINNVLHFAKELNKIISKNTNVSLQNLNTTDMYKIFPRITWLHFINNLTGDSNFTVSEEDTSIVASYEYLQELDLLLAGTSLRTQINFINWRIIQEFGYYLPTPIRENFVNFTNFLVPYDKQINTRFDFCTRDARTRFAGVAEYQYFKLHVAEKKQGIREITANIKEQFALYLEGLNWIHHCTTEILGNELDKIVDVIEPELDYDKYNNDKFFKVSDLEFTTDNIIDMVREKNMDDFWIQFTPTDLPSIADLPMHISSQVHQDILYNKNRPNYLNYGALGSIIGREISRMFSQGSYYSYAEEMDIDTGCEEIADIEGFISSNTTELFQNTTENATDIINLLYTNFGINGRIEFSENFDEIVGIHAAYMAYNKWTEENGVEEPLPGLPYTPTQLFWLQFNVVNCYSKIDSIQWSIDETIQDSMRYSDMNFLRFSEYFKTDFECPS